MRFPAALYSSFTVYFTKNLIRGRKRAPLVLMLEPTHRCNLECAGCDRIRLHNEEQSRDLSLGECMEAARDSEAPVVTITGGEPLLYPDLGPLVDGLLRMKRHVYLCTNGILTEAFIEASSPHPRLTLNFHLDGMEETHDRITCRPGTFSKALENIKKAKQKGFRVSTNTSVYRNSDTGELERLFELLKSVHVDGTLIAPAFSYERVKDDIFLTRREAVERFREMADFFVRFPFINSPLYVDFLKGERQMHCTPWGNPTRNPLGWKSPCYLITDSYHKTFREMIERTAWEKYESGLDPRCRDCMVHSGYEATSMREAFSSPRDLFRLLLWNLKS